MSIDNASIRWPELQAKAQQHPNGLAGLVTELVEESAWERADKIAGSILLEVVEPMQEHIDDLLEELERLRQGNWTACADQLPEDGHVKIVAAYTEMSPGRFRYLTLKRTFYYDEEQRSWIRNGQPDTGPTTHNITHWQDMPKPPQA